LTPDNEATQRVQNLVEERRKLVEEKTAQLNGLIGYLKDMFSADAGMVCEVGHQAGIRGGRNFFTSLGGTARNSSSDTGAAGMES
jgi:hypothetical protein